MNKWIWLLAFANFFAYITRYSMLDWGPMYLREVKGTTLADGIAYLQKKSFFFIFSVRSGFGRE